MFLLYGLQEYMYLSFSDEQLRLNQLEFWWLELGLHATLTIHSGLDIAKNYT